jgi:DNA-binding GntR family transcriptional regulator
MDHIKRGMLRNDVYKKLRNDILDHVYKDGESLTESKITKDLGVSRTPIREAFAQLHADGLVDVVPNKGVTVRGINGNDIKDIYDVRAHIENLAVKKACMNANDENLNLLEEIISSEMNQIQENDLYGFLESDDRFHYTIMQLSGSYLYIHLLTSMLEHTRVARKTSVSNVGRIDKSYGEHKEIYESIRTRNCRKAQALMRKHLMNAKKSFIKTIIKEESI